jgi:hypothetical protein
MASVAGAATDAMVTASRLTTGAAALALLVGLAATFRLPPRAAGTTDEEAAPGPASAGDAPDSG